MLPPLIAIQLQYQNLAVRLALIQPLFDKADAPLDRRVGQAGIERRDRATLFRDRRRRLGAPERKHDQKHTYERRENGAAQTVEHAGAPVFKADARIRGELAGLQPSGVVCRNRGTPYRIVVLGSM